MPILEKTDRQQLLELQHGKPIKKLLEEAYRRHEGERHTVAAAALDLGLSTVTFHKWTIRFGVDLKNCDGDEDGEDGGAAAGVTARKPDAGQDGGATA